MADGTEAGVQFRLLGLPQVSANRVGPGEHPDIEPVIGLHACLDSLGSPKGDAFRA